MVSAAKLKKMLLAEIAVQPMSLKEIAEKMELKEKRTYRLLKSLFEKDQIQSSRGEDGVRRYSPSEEAE
jgi:DNA-binding MarR family transcriptional regulator